MAYAFTTDKKGNRRFARVGVARAIATPKGKVTIERAKPAEVAKVDIDSGEAVAVETADVDAATASVSVPTTPKAKSSGKKS